jgi:ferric-chelate reductase
VLLFLVLWISAAQARSSIVPVNEQYVDFIVTAYTYITFAGPTSRKFLDQQCHNPLAVTSIYASSDVYCQPEEREAGIARLDGICSDAGLELLSRDSVWENLTEDAIRGMRRVDYGELDMLESIKYPVLLSVEHFRRVFLTMVGSPCLSSRNIFNAVYRIHGHLKAGRIMHMGTDR